VQDNLKKLEHYGFSIITPAVGYLACGDTGAGKMPEPEVLLKHILHHIAHEKDLLGKRVLITAGPTQEAIDPVRFITNHSTGKMGYALAENCAMRGATVTLVSGAVALDPPLFVETVPVVSAADMAEEVLKRADAQDIIIKTAAVADFRPASPKTEKIKKQDGAVSVIELEKTQDILSWLGAHKRLGQFICGFSMETEHMLENSRAKLEKKQVDMIVANNLKVEGAGFGTDTNVVTFITKDDCRELPIMSKSEVAEAIVSEIVARI
jgi:phosphopantothenoylcysteine decarboxylase/phosphopantothenate--cysteine ligase